MRARFTSDSVGVDLDFRDLTTSFIVWSIKTSAEPMGMPRARASRVRDFFSATGSKV